MLYATVRQRKIHVKNPTTIIQNGVNVDELILEMDDEWGELDSIVAVFTLKYTEKEEKTEGEETTTTIVSKEISKEMLHTFGQPITVPWECLAHTGRLMVSCTGYVAGEKVMTTMYPDSFWNVVQNGPMTGDETMEPTPTMYEQIIAAANSANAAAQAATEARAELLQDKASGVFDGKNGEAATLVITGVDALPADSKPTVTENEGSTEQKRSYKLGIPSGRQGGKGDPFTYDDFTPEQLAALKGEPFKYEDFTPEQLEALRGPKGSAFTYEDFTPEQLESLRGPKGDAFKYEDFTPEQLAALVGEPGNDIDSIQRTKGNGAPGTTDTYTVTLADGKTHEFYVYNGKDGEGAGDMTSGVYDPQGKKQDLFKYVDDSVKNIPTPDVSGQIGAHNTATDAHNDLRLLITELTNRLNALANSEDVDLDQMAELVAYIKDNRGLIEQITTNKVNVSDIVNNLTTNVSNKPLSAAQGVALKALIDGIFVPTKTSQLTNDSGFFNTKPSYTASEVGAAPELHEHNASDINAGTLSLARGGTGLSVSTLSEFATAMGAAQVATGTYSGNGSTTLRVTFPFVPKFVACIAYDLMNKGGAWYWSGGVRFVGQKSSSVGGGAAALNGSTLTLTENFFSDGVKYGANYSGVTYSWVAFA